MPVRRMAAAGAMALYRFSTSRSYPTRTVESFIAWVLIVWSISVIEDPAMLTTRAVRNYSAMVSLMSPLAWGWIGIAIASSRIIALIGNGHFRPSPELRLAGAAWGMMFWAALAWCYYWDVAAGAPDFPMRRCFYVFIIFEAYSCYRCGLDIGRRRREDEGRLSGARSAGNG